MASFDLADCTSAAVAFADCTSAVAFADYTADFDLDYLASEEVVASEVFAVSP